VECEDLDSDVSDICGEDIDIRDGPFKKTTGIKCNRTNWFLQENKIPSCSTIHSQLLFIEQSLLLVKTIPCHVLQNAVYLLTFLDTH
jgi:hypothetical protein